MNRALYAPLALALLVGMSSCGGDPGVSSPAVVRTIEAVTPLSSTGTVGTDLLVSPSVRVKDSFGAPVADVDVVFWKRSPAGEGNVVHSSMRTGVDGIATAAPWRLETRAGTHVLKAQIRTSTAMVFFGATALPGPAASMRATDSMPAGAPGSVWQVRVRIADEFDNAVQATTVTFRVETGTGDLTSTVAVSDSAGIATAEWRLGQVGDNSVTASAPGLVDVRFTTVAVEGLTYYEFVADEGISPAAAWITLGPANRFATYFNGLKGGGTFVVNGAHIGLSYGDDFLLELRSREDIFAYPSSLKEEAGTVSADAIVIIRCFSEDCYERRMTYRKK